MLADKMQPFLLFLLPLLLPSASGSAVRSADESAAIYLDRELFNKLLNVHRQDDSFSEHVPLEERQLELDDSFQQELISKLLAMGQMDQQLLGMLHERKDFLLLVRQNSGISG